MEHVETNRYLFLKPTDNPNVTYTIDRYSDYGKGDTVAVKHGNGARVESYNHQSNILGKALGYYRPL